MIAYLDSSAALRKILNQQNQIVELKKIDRAVASKLLKAESFRALDRLRLLGSLNEVEFVKTSEELYQFLDLVELVEISDSILDRVGGSFSIGLGTLDAIHLSSALLWREKTGLQLSFFTHDEALGRAARSLGFSVFGCTET